MKFDPFDVLSIIQTVARDEILPRFQRLADHEITEKAPGDLVTIADIEAEQRLTIELSALVGGSVVVGEEGVAETPASLTALDGDKPVWIIDPVDGTKNFANGKPCFAVMVALCRHQQAEAAWIYDPINKTAIHAVRGQGAFETNNDGTTALRAPERMPVSAMTGSVGPRRTQELMDLRTAGDTSIPALIKRYRCVGREYMDLARGKLQFLRYGGNLKPWDHVPGILIHRELGGYNAMSKTNTPYCISSEKSFDTILLAPNPDKWKELETLIDS